MHGSAKDDWVTEWGPLVASVKKNVTRVPFGAAKLDGLNANAFPGATLTFICPVVFATAEGAAAAAAEEEEEEEDEALGAGPPYC